MKKGNLGEKRIGASKEGLGQTRLWWNKAHWAGPNVLGENPSVLGLFVPFRRPPPFCPPPAPVAALRPRPLRASPRQRRLGQSGRGERGGLRRLAAWGAVGVARLAVAMATAARRRSPWQRGLAAPGEQAPPPPSPAPSEPRPSRLIDTSGAGPVADLLCNHRARAPEAPRSPRPLRRKSRPHSGARCRKCPSASSGLAPEVPPLRRPAPEVLGAASSARRKSRLTGPQPGSPGPAAGSPRPEGPIRGVTSRPGWGGGAHGSRHVGEPTANQEAPFPRPRPLG